MYVQPGAVAIWMHSGRLHIHTDAAMFDSSAAIRAGGVWDGIGSCWHFPNDRTADALGLIVDVFQHPTSSRS